LGKVMDKEIKDLFNQLIDMVDSYEYSMNQTMPGLIDKINLIQDKVQELIDLNIPMSKIKIK